MNSMDDSSKLEHQMALVQIFKCLIGPKQILWDTILESNMHFFVTFIKSNRTQYATLIEIFSKAYLILKSNIPIHIGHFPSPLIIKSVYPAMIDTFCTFLTYIELFHNFSESQVCSIKYSNEHIFKFMRPKYILILA